MKKLSQYIDRSNSVVSPKEDLEHLYTFKDFPVFMGCTEQDISNDLLGDMVWEIDSFGLVQLSKLVPMDILYMDQHMDATGATWAMYNQELADFIVQHKKGNILEIGGGSGKLAKLILDKDKNVQYTVVEPNPVFEEQNNLKIIRSFFSRQMEKPGGDIDTVVLSQVLEHVYNPMNFLSEVYDFLPENGRFLFGYPNLEHLFSNKFTNAINFEHTMLMTEYFLDYFLEQSGFSILSKVDYLNHSHFYAVEKKQKPAEKILPVSRYEHYKNMFREYISYHEDLVANINQKISSTSGQVYLFGAHIFSQYLFAFGLDASRIAMILDNSPIKQGKRLYGSPLLVNSPKILKDVENPVVVLKAGLYNQEIMEDILTNINPNTKFI